MSIHHQVGEPAVPAEESGTETDTPLSKAELREEVLALLREWLDEANTLARERGMTPAAALGLALGVLQHHKETDA
jgi:hypothetical protein